VATFEVVFDDDWFADDVARASGRGKTIARQARAEIAASGLASEQLLRCEAEGPDGTRLANCVKTYLGPPTGRGPGHWGMVFVLVHRPEGFRLRYLAFGVRHQPQLGRAPTVYQIADRRLNHP
jgi:hypothetical protein